MDLTLDDEQTALVTLAGRILADLLPPARLKEIEAADPVFAAEVWAAFARADLLGLWVPEEHGGSGYGVFELALLLETVGFATAPIPLLETMALGVMPIVEFGDADQRAAILPGVVAGDTILTAALGEDGRTEPPARPATTAVRSGDRWRLDGTKTLVPAAGIADRILVPATTDSGTTVFVVDPAADGVRLESNRSIDASSVSTLTLGGTEVDDAAVLGTVGGGDPIVHRIRALGIAGSAAIQTGVCEAATRITAEYASSRHQFGSPIATFQAVAHRVADAYIDTEAIRLTARRAAWALDAGLDASEELAIAGFWAADGAHRVVHAAQHVHGGIGVDTDYPVHRMYRWAKRLEFGFGHATDHLRALGRELARAR